MLIALGADYWHSRVEISTDHAACPGSKTVSVFQVFVAFDKLYLRFLDKFRLGSGLPYQCLSSGLPSCLTSKLQGVVTIRSTVLVGDHSVAAREGIVRE